MSQPTGVLEMLIAAIQAQTSAIEANTAAILGGASPAKTEKPAASGGKKNTKPATEKTGPKHTKEVVVAAVVAFKDAAGAPAARDLLAEFGIDKVANTPEDKFDQVYEAAVSALEEFNKGGNDEGSDDDI